jgi:hypothetical protein
MPICLDLFTSISEERIRRSPAEVLVVPSLSPTLTRHRIAMRSLVERLWAIGFVCNRAPGDTSANPDCPNAPTGNAKNPPDDGSVWNEEANRSFWMSQREPDASFERRPAGAHHSFVFRLSEAIEKSNARKKREKKAQDASRNGGTRATDETNA